jgi:Domain of unknown function (DUF1851)
VKVTWSDLAFLPSEAALASLVEAWSWLLPTSFEPVMATALGDVFFQQGSPEVYWLDTGTATISRIAASRAEFQELLKTDQADEWFMPGLVAQLKESGKHLLPDQCYTFVVLPVFKEGKYEASNLNPVPAREHFGVTGEIHRQIRELPDGAKIKIHPK